VHPPADLVGIALARSAAGEPCGDAGALRVELE
jgi:hypothetical protein